jgi:hypothetical protein
MALFDTTWYVNNVGYTAVAAWATGATIAAGALRRQLAAPAVGSERVFVAIVGGTTHATTEPTWVTTRGAKTTDNTVTWQECTGASAVNGDLTNTPTWSAARAINTAVTLGAIIQRNNGASYWICSTAGSVGASEPAWANNTAGTTQADSTVTWTCLGVVGNFTGGQAPHARLATACSLGFVAGNTVYVGDNHAETQATTLALTLVLGQTTVSKVVCHNHSGNYPPAAADLATGATVTETGSGLAINLAANNGVLYVYGLTFSNTLNGNITLNGQGSFLSFDNCTFKVATANIVPNSGTMLWNNCQVNFTNAGSSITVVGNFIWQNTAQVLVTGSTVPTNLFSMTSPGNIDSILLEALDLSQCVGIFAQLANTVAGNWVIKDCKLNASTTFPNETNTGHVLQTIRADSGATAYKSARYAVEGSETTETAITRVGGASDPTGQAQSRKIVTTANSQWLRPFKAEPYAIWNSTTGAAVTVTVYGTINAGALPNNDDIWMEVEYLGSSSFPIGTIKTTTKASLLAANAAVSSDGSTWNGGGSGAGWSPFKLTTTLSSPQPGMAGYLHARVRAAKVSTTYYIDPKIVLT